MTVNSTRGGVTHLRVGETTPVTDWWKLELTDFGVGNGLSLQTLRVAGLVGVDCVRGGRAVREVVPLLVEDLAYGTADEAVRNHYTEQQAHPGNPLVTTEFGYFGSVESVRGRVMVVAREATVDRSGAGTAYGHTWTIRPRDGAPASIYGPGAGIEHYRSRCTVCLGLVSAADRPAPSPLSSSCPPSKPMARRRVTIDDLIDLMGGVTV